MDFKNIFDNVEVLKDETLLYLSAKGREGDDYQAINKALVFRLTLSEEMLAHHWVREKLKAVRNLLKKEGRIGFNAKTKIWYLKNPDMSGADEIGPGWKKIPDKISAIQWLYKNFSPAEFEKLCVAILNIQFRMPIQITEKRCFSGADGGFDGFGRCNIHGKDEDIALEVKRYALSKQVGEDHLHKFIGVLTAKNWNHGIFITTAKFSQRFQEKAKMLEGRDIWVELIDQDRLAEIMLTKTDHANGFGLHRRGENIYLNEKILRDAVK